jgi:hypothetical protein
MPLSTYEGRMPVVGLTDWFLRTHEWEDPHATHQGPMGFWEDTWRNVRNTALYQVPAAVVGGLGNWLAEGYFHDADYDWRKDARIPTYRYPEEIFENVRSWEMAVDAMRRYDAWVRDRSARAAHPVASLLTGLGAGAADFMVLRQIPLIGGLGHRLGFVAREAVEGLPAWVAARETVGAAKEAARVAAKEAVRGAAKEAAEVARKVPRHPSILSHVIEGSTAAALDVGILELAKTFASEYETFGENIGSIGANVLLGAALGGAFSYVGARRSGTFTKSLKSSAVTGIKKKTAAGNVTVPGGTDLSGIGEMLDRESKATSTRMENLLREPEVSAAEKWPGGEAPKTEPVNISDEAYLSRMDQILGPETDTVSLEPTEWTEGAGEFTSQLVGRNPEISAFHRFNARYGNVKKLRDKLLEDVESYCKLWAEDTIVPELDPGQIPTPEQVVGRYSAQLGQTVVGENFLRKVYCSSVLRGQTSHSSIIRGICMDLADGHSLRRVLSGEPIRSVDVGIRIHKNRLNTAVTKTLRETFKRMGKDNNPEFSKLSADEFRLQVTRALREGDVSPNPYAQEAAKGLREVMTELRDLYKSGDLGGHQAQWAETYAEDVAEREAILRRLEAKAPEYDATQVDQYVKDAVKEQMRREERAGVVRRGETVTNDRKRNTKGFQEIKEQLRKGKKLSNEQMATFEEAPEQIVWEESELKKMDREDRERVNALRRQIRVNAGQLRRITKNQEITEKNVDKIMAKLNEHNRLESKQRAMRRAFHGKNIRKARLREIEKYDGEVRGARERLEEARRSLERVRKGELTDEEWGFDKTDKSYLPRVWNIREIKERLLEFVKRLQGVLLRENPMMQPEEAKKAAYDIAYTITGGSHLRTETKLKYQVKVRGMERNRILNVQSSEFEDFLVNDPEALLRRLTETIVPDHHIKMRLGSTDLGEYTPKIRAEYNAMVEAGKMTSAEAAEDMRRGMAAISETLGKVRGTSFRSGDAMWLGRKSRDMLGFMRGVTSSLVLGRLFLTSLYDLGTCILTLNFREALGGVLPRFIKNIFRGGISAAEREELALLGIALDAQFSECHGRMGSQYMDPTWTGRLERAGGKLREFTYRWSGAKHFLETIHLTAAEGCVIRLRTLAKKVRAGEVLSKNESLFLNKCRLSVANLGEIAEQMAKFSTDDGKVFDLNLPSWESANAKENMHYAVNMAPDYCSMYPGTEVPAAFESSPLLTTIFQFKKFLYASYAKTMIPSTQALAMGDLEVIPQLLCTVAMGGLRTCIIRAAEGKPMPTAEKFLVDGVAASDALPVIGDLFRDLVDGFDHGDWIGGLWDGVTSFFRPLFIQFPANVLRGANGVSHALFHPEGMTKGELQAITKCIPANNFIYVSGLMKAWVESLDRPISRKKPAKKSHKSTH